MTQDRIRETLEGYERDIVSLRAINADLLAAAKVAAILIVQGYGTMGKGFQDAPADHVDAKRRLEAAIAKAEGKDPQVASTEPIYTIRRIFRSK